MTNHDVAVAIPSDDTNDERPDRSLGEQLVDQARADGKNLVGPGGLPSDLTKQVLETGIEVEIEDISVIRSMPPRAATTAIAAMASAPRQ